MLNLHLERDKGLIIKDQNGILVRKSDSCMEIVKKNGGENLFLEVCNELRAIRTIRFCSRGTKNNDDARPEDFDRIVIKNIEKFREMINFPFLFPVLNSLVS